MAKCQSDHSVKSRADIAEFGRGASRMWTTPPENGAIPMSDAHHLEFTRPFLEACTDLKLLELQDGLLRELSEDRYDDRCAVSEELERRQKKAHDDLRF